MKPRISKVTEAVAATKLFPNYGIPYYREVIYYLRKTQHPYRTKLVWYGKSLRNKIIIRAEGLNKAWW